MPVLIFMTIYTVAIEFIFDYFVISHESFPGTIAMHSLLGIVLGLFLVFRINSAYDRWWEGRKLWGGLVNSTRNFALKLSAYLDAEDTETRDWFSKMIPNFVFSMKEHLRKGVKFNELEPVSGHFENDLRKFAHRPNRISAMLYGKVNELYKKNEISGYQMLALDKELKDFMQLPRAMASSG